MAVVLETKRERIGSLFLVLNPGISLFQVLDRGRGGLPVLLESLDVVLELLNLEVALVDLIVLGLLVCLQGLQLPIKGHKLVSLNLEGLLGVIVLILRVIDQKEEKK